MASDGDEPTEEWTEAERASQELNVDAFTADLESRYMAVKHEKETLERERIKDQALLTELQAKTTSLQESLMVKGTELATAKRERNTLREENENRWAEEKTQQERMNRMEAEADNLREEISRLTESNKTLSSQVVEMETKSKLTESQAVPLSYEVERTRKELDSLSAHKQWLEKELQERNQLLVEEKQKHSEHALVISQKLDMAIMERDEVKSTIAALKQSQHILRNKTEELSLELREAKEEAANIKDSLQQELQQERHLVALQKEQLDRLTHLYNRVVKENESLKELGNRASQTTQREIEEVRLSVQEEAQRIIEEQNDRHSRQIELFKSQLDDAIRMRKEAEDGFMASPRPHLGASNRPMLMHDSDEPLGLTDLYERLAQTEDALQEKTTECKRMSLILQKIEADVEAKTPLFMRQRVECEMVKEQAEESRSRLQAALGELSSVRQDLKEVSLDKEELRKQNRELRQETTVLAKQVQALLVSRAGGEANAEIPITVEEIQTQNQQLLQEHRRLSSTIMELEEKLRMDSLQRELEEAKAQLMTLHEDRERQEFLVKGIVQQRDLYRALLGQHDSALVGEGTDPVAAQTEKNKALALRNGELETNLAKARADLDGLARDKETLEHRVARYDMHTTELTSSVNKLQSELSSALKTVTRTEADAAYHRDKCVRLEETLQQSRSEVQRMQDTINSLHSVNSNLQKSVASANAEASKWEQESRQAGMKLRLAETQVETAKASELRLSTEVTQLRTELARQGALLDSVQRIEASLSARSEEAKEKLTEDCQRLQQTLSAERSKHSLELENLNGHIRELEVDLKSVEAKKDEALTSVIEAKKEGLITAKETKQLTLKCAGLEAELRSARRKLGLDDTESENTELALETKVLALATDLEAARGELGAAKERVITYQKLAKTNEGALSDLTKVTDEFKRSHQEQVNALELKLEEAKKDIEMKQQLIIQLTEDLANIRGEQEKAVAELKGKVATLEADAESLKIDAEVAESRVAAMDAEVARYRAEATSAQSNYERELNMHSAARTSLRSAREEADLEILLRRKVEEQLELVNDQIEEERKLWDDQKKKVDLTIKDLERSLEDSRSQNALLHRQLAAQGDQLAKLQSDKIDAAAAADDATTDEGRIGTESLRSVVEALRKSESDLRETVRYMRSENETSRARENAARRTAETEKAVAAATKRSLVEARTELKILRNNQANVAESDVTRTKELKEKLDAASEQLTLLRESNKLLREESDKFQATVLSLQSELSISKNSVAPNEKRLQELEVDKGALEAEKASLIRELEAWKGRVRSLVSSSKQIDPDEHEKALKQLDELKKECESLKTMKESADKASGNAKMLITRLNKELSQQRALVDAQKKKAAAASSQASTDAIQERDQLKVKIEKLEKEAVEDKKALEGATQRVETFKKHLRNFQKQIGDLKQQVAQTTSELEVSKAELEAARAAPAGHASGLAPPSSVTAEAAPPQEPMSLEKPEAAGTAKVVPDPTKVVPKTTPTDAPKSEPVKVAEVEPAAKTPPEVPPGGFKFGPGGSLKPPPSKMPRKTLKGVSPQVSGGAVAKQEAVVAQGVLTTIAQSVVTTAQAPDASAAAVAETNSKESVMREKLLLLKKRKAELMKGEEERAQKRALIAAAGQSGDEIAGDEAAKKVEEAAGGQELVAPGSTEGVASMPMESEPVEETPTPASEPMAPESSVPEGEGAEPEVAEKGVDESKEDTPSSEAAEATPIETEKGTTSLEAAEATPIETEPESQAPDESKGKAEPAKPDVPAKATLFGGPPTFGSVSAFGSGTTFGTTGFGVSASPLAFGTSSTIAKTTTKEGEGPPTPAPTASGSAASTEKPTAFGSGGPFLDIKPPSATAPKFTFGSSPNITLPIPAKGLPASSGTTFGVFGHGGASPFGRGMAQSPQAQPLFGAPVKRPLPVDEGDEGQESAAKHPRIEEEEGEVDEKDDVGDDDEADLEEGEEADENEVAEG